MGEISFWEPECTELAQAKKFELIWLSSVTSLAGLGLKSIWNIRAKLGLGLEDSGTSELGLDSAQNEVEF